MHHGGYLPSSLDIQLFSRTQGRRQFFPDILLAYRVDAPEVSQEYKVAQFLWQLEGESRRANCPCHAAGGFNRLTAFATGSPEREGGMARFTSQLSQLQSLWGCEGPYQLGVSQNRKPLLDGVEGKPKGHQPPEVPNLEKHPEIHTEKGLV